MNKYAALKVNESKQTVARLWLKVYGSEGYRGGGGGVFTFRVGNGEWQAQSHRRCARAGER
jgi:hypothetical protein